MPIIPFPEYKPDVADYQTQTTRNILNVIPRGDGYGPFGSFAASSQALPAACRGDFQALKSDGTVQEFAATSKGLYRQNNTDLSWVPVGKLANCTISNASPGVVTYTNTFASLEPVVFAAGAGTLPSQIVAGTVYYVHPTGLSGTAFSVSATAGGTRINTSGGSGTVKITAYYGALSSNANWQFTQAGNLVFATQANDVLQVYDLSSSSQFSDALGSPPQAAYIANVGRFLLLTGLLSNPFRAQWSGLNSYNASSSWDNTTAGSNYQDLPDGGVVRGAAGGEFGTIFQDQTIRRIAYVGGAVVMQIERITEDLGLFAPYSIIRSGSSIFFYAGQGFHRIDPGQPPVPIGFERVDRTFKIDLDASNLQLFQGATDPRSPLVYWAYKSGAGASGLYDKILAYHKALDRFFPINMTGEYLRGMSAPGITLEGLDSISTNVDTMTLTFDAYASSVQPQIGQFDANHKRGYFAGANLEATLETGEQGTDGRRIKLKKGFRPITDAPTVYGSASSRESLQGTVIAGNESLVNSTTGICNMLVDARLSRFKCRIPAGTSWTYINGVEPADLTATGRR